MSVIGPKDVGCGHGASTIVMAQAYPKSQFFGFEPSLDRATTLAREAGVGDRITFEQASAKDLPARGYDLVAFFDCLHDMGDPVGAGRSSPRSLLPNERPVALLNEKQLLALLRQLNSSRTL